MDHRGPDRYQHRGGPPPDYYYGGRGGRGYMQDHRGDHRGGNNRHGPPRGPPRGGGYDRRPPPSRSGNSRRRNPNYEVMRFRSREEEMDWLDDRRRKRQARQGPEHTKWDQPPTAEQLAATQAGAEGGNSLFPTATCIPAIVNPALSSNPQQTRHARRLYVGNLPFGISEQRIEAAFGDAIEKALVEPMDQSSKSQWILNVYLNAERHFCFIEFSSVELTTACMELDGLYLEPDQPPVKIKRPNDYNPTTAPAVTNLPKLDVSRLGIISPTVPDGPHKIFIGGLHYHLQEPQVVELLQAFGKVQAFHLVKNDADGSSKGYCFVQYADPAITPVAVQGLNGMEIGGGKTMTARLAGERGGETSSTMPVAVAPVSAATTTTTTASSSTTPDPHRTIISGYDIEELVDASMGLKPMPTAPQYLDPFTGQPLTRIVPVGMMSIQQTPTIASASSILVLHNMVTEEDLATDEDYEGLLDEVRDECRKLGELQQIEIPRNSKKLVYLKYATVAEATKAQGALQGRQFGDATVETSFYAEQDFASGKWKE